MTLYLLLSVDGQFSGRVLSSKEGQLLEQFNWCTLVVGERFERMHLITVTGLVVTGIVVGLAGLAVESLQMQSG